MQKIYLAGAGAITAEEGWIRITKPENFRCPTSVLSVINRIRAEDDRLTQIAATRIGPDGPIPPRIGAAKLFIVQAGPDRNARLSQARQLMAAANDDPLWQSDEQEGNVRVLVLVHRIAASRLGFPDLYAALNDNGATRLKDGCLEGTAWVLRPFIQYLLPLMLAARAGDHFAVMSSLRNDCPLLAKDRIADQDVAALLERIRTDVDTFVYMFRAGSVSTIRQVLAFVHERQLAELDQRFIPYLTDAAPEDPEDEHSDYQGVLAFLATPATQLLGYRRYIESESPFSTQQGIKGAEFTRVLVVLDDEESDYRQFSYGKYWGIEALSATDSENIRAQMDSVLDRTRRLFYVCCSRALQDLAVVLFVPNVQNAQRAVLAKGIFAPEDIHILDGPLP